MEKMTVWDSLDFHEDLAHETPAMADSSHIRIMEGTWLPCHQLETRAF